MIYITAFSIFAISSLFIYVYGKKIDKDKWSNKDIGYCVFKIFFISFVMSFVVFCISIVLTYFIPDSDYAYEKMSDQRIVSLSDSQTNTFLRYSSTSDLNYYYAVDTTDGIKIESVGKKSTYIKYTDKNFRVEKYQYKYTKKGSLYEKLFLYKPDEFLSPKIDKYKTTFYVPKGSVVENYNVDLQ